MEYVMKKRPNICTTKLRNIQMVVEYRILYIYYVIQFYSSIHPQLKGIVAFYGVHERLAPAADSNRLRSDSTWRPAFEKFAMFAQVPLGSGFDGALPRKRRGICVPQQRARDVTKIDAKTSAPANALTGEVVITRIFDAPRGLVFKAWTDPENMPRWRGPKGFANPICELDARAGGAWRIVMRSPAHIEYPCGGLYREIVEPERLVFTNIAMDNEGNPALDGLTTVIFAERGGKTKLTLQMRAVAVAAHAAAYLAGMETGWTKSLERLAEELARS